MFTSGWRAHFRRLLTPSQQKCAPASPLLESRVSAALQSRDAGEDRARLSDPGWSGVIEHLWAWGSCCLMAVLIREENSLRFDCTSRGERFVERLTAPVTWRTQTQVEGLQLLLPPFAEPLAGAKSSLKKLTTPPKIGGNVSRRSNTLPSRSNLQ